MKRFAIPAAVLALTGAFYMLQIYDRVVPSQSIPTLIGLAAMGMAALIGNLVS